MSEVKTVVNHQKVTDMLMKMLSIGGHLIVDINKQVHYSLSPNDPICIPVKGEKIPKTLYIYDTNINDPNAIIINPLAETAAVGPERLMFYSVLAYVQSQWVWKILNFIVNESVAHKKDMTDVDLDLAAIITSFIDQVDEKMLVELETIKGAGIKDFCNIYYNRMQKSSTLLLGIEDESGDYFKIFPSGKVRKKSWTVFTNILKFILNVDETKIIKEEYTSKTDKVDCPHFTTFSSIWLKVWDQLVPYMRWFDSNGDEDEVVDALKEHFKYIPVYRECVMWLKQPTARVENKFIVPNEVPAVNSTSANNVITIAQQPQIQPAQVVPHTPSWSVQQQQPDQCYSQQQVRTPSWMPVAQPVAVNQYVNNRQNNRGNIVTVAPVRSW